MFLKIVVAYLLFGCIMSIWLTASGKMNVDCADTVKPLTRILSRIFIIIIVPVLTPISIIMYLFGNQPPKN